MIPISLKIYLVYRYIVKLTGYDLLGIYNLIIRIDFLSVNSLFTVINIQVIAVATPPILTENKMHKNRISLTVIISI